MGPEVIAALKVASTVFSVVSTISSFSAQKNEGIAAQQEARFRASQLEQRAGQSRAAAQRQAIIERKRGTLAESKAQAIAAAGGGGALDPSVVSIMGDLNDEAEMNASNALYEGEERARDDQSEASITRWEGAQKKKAGFLAARNTIFSGAADIGNSLLDKYG